MKNLILVRHGQSVWNKDRRFTGWADVDLTDKGKSEADYAGKLIKNLNIKIEKYFTSYQKRAINTLEIILKILDIPKNNINKAWELNERHYGDLTGLNKDEMIKKHGSKQVLIWRRSYNTPPPPIKSTNPNNPINNRAYSKIPIEKIPKTESLKNTFERVVPYYENNIEPLILSGENILISAHGNSLRALCKKIFKIPNKKILNFEIPTGNPLLITFDDNLNVEVCKYLDIKRAKKFPFNF